MNLSSIPNILTVSRLVLIAPIVYFLVKHQYETALIIFFIAAFTDAIDGVIARRFGWQSRFGSVMDPLADKAMMISAYLALGWAGLLPGWIVALVLFRDVLIIGGATTYHMTIGRVSMEPSILSKLNTFVQSMLALLVVLFQLMSDVNEQIIPMLIYLTAVTTVTSGFSYVRVWSRRAIEARKELHGDE